MSWPVPTPAAIADRAASVYEAELPGIDARSRNRVATATTRVVGITGTDMHLHIAAQAAELMPTTAVETLDAKAAVYGLTRQGPSYSTGSGSAAGIEETPIPSGVLLASGSYLAETTAAVSIVGGVATVALKSRLAGTAGAIPAGTVLVPVSPVAGLNPQSITVTGDGVAGGLDAETDDDLRARLLIEIRKGDEDGTVYYRRIVLAVLPSAIVSVRPASPGVGSVTVVVAMPGPIAATAGQVATVDAAVQAGRSVGVRQAFTLAAVLHPVDVQIHLNPDTAAGRVAATAALAAQFALDAAIGGTVFTSRLDAAISGAGEYSHERLAPLADVVLGPSEVASLGVVDWA